MSALKPYTVVGFIDGDARVYTFVERIMAKDSYHAWDVAVREARTSSNPGWGGPHDWEWGNATEIAVFAGHVENATD